MKKTAMLMFVLSCGASAFAADNPLAGIIAQSREQEVAEAGNPPVSPEARANYYGKEVVVVGLPYAPQTALFSTFGEAARVLYSQVLTDLQPKRLACPAGAKCMAGVQKQSKNILCIHLDKEQPDGTVLSDTAQQWTCILKINDKGEALRHTQFMVLPQ